MQVLAIVGPTASGKTALGVELALAQSGEVVSADSRQVYRGLNLGTGKVTPVERRAVPHHLLDVADPRERFTVHDFVRLGRAAMSGIAARGKLPIVVGGTGLYVDALLGSVPLNAPPPDPVLRARIATSDVTMLRDELKQVDPERYARTDLKNRRRVERALEISLSPPSINYELPAISFSTTWIGLTLPRDVLKERIHTRLVGRLEAGMLDEAQKLHTSGLTYKRMDELGLEYRYMSKHLKGLLSYDEMVATLESEIYKYAKRQMTWFKRNKEIHWLDATSPTLQEQALAAFA